ALSGRAMRGSAQKPDRPVHRARGTKLEDRESALVGTVRPDAGVFDRVLRVLARGVPSRAEREMATVVAGAPLPPDCSHGARCQGQAVPLRTVDPGEMGGTAR